MSVVVRRNGPAGKPIRASTTVRILAQPTARQPGGKS
jgi:hypothetical protein